MNRTTHRAAASTLLALALGAPTPAQASAFPLSPTLSASESFPALGTSVQFSLAAPQGALFAIHAAAAPAELALGELGTLFLDPLAMFPLASGVVPPSGAANASLAIPPLPALAGAVLYLQGGAALLPEIRLSNAIAIRAELVPKSGARGPLSVAAAPGGDKLFVANRDDGTVAIVDAQAGALVRVLPAGPSARGLPHGPVHVAIDPEGRHAFALNAAAQTLLAIDVASDSIAAAIPVPEGCKRIAFDFSGGVRRIFVTNDVEQRVLVLDEAPLGQFAARPPLELAGRGPGPLVVLSDGRLVVGQLETHELELVDPLAGAGQTTLARLALGRLPYDLVERAGELLVSSFTFTPGGPTDGDNHVLRVRLSSFQLVGTLFENDGTDYLDLAAAGPFLAVTCSGSGSVLVADAATLALVERVVLAPGQPIATPKQSAFGGPDVLFVLDHFRETLRPVLLAGGPPFALGAEIPLARSGAPRVPLVDLTPQEDGERFFQSVQFFNGTPLVPNPVTCATCHPDSGSDGLNHARNTIPLFRSAETGPFGWSGFGASLPGFIAGAFNAHGSFPGPPSAQGPESMLAFLTSSPVPPSPFLSPDGALSAEALAGKALFEGAAGCAACHAAPLFIPQAPAPATIGAGVGTGLAPANVPSLRGLWATAPYLHDGSAGTLAGVLLANPGDQHGATSTLGALERAQLVAYLRTL